MKKHLLLSSKAVMLCACFFAAILASNAQTEGNGFTVRIVTPSTIAKDIPEDFQNCGWIGTRDFGPELTDDLCGDVVWAMPDSFGCNPLPAGSLNGKIALIRRGGVPAACGFSLKIYRAQEAGAKAVIVLNHNLNAADGPCQSYIGATGQLFGAMGASDSATAVTIPAVFLQRQNADEISGALAAGEKVEVCFIFPRMAEQTAVYHYATPLNQVDSIGEGIMSVRFTNRSAAPLTNAVVKADIESPSGSVQSLSVTLDALAVNADTLVSFPAYAPEKVKGKFKVTFSNSAFTEPRDSVTTFFEHTDHTFASDNLVVDPLGVGVSTADFITGNFIIQNGALYVTGPDGGDATYVTFGVANIDSLWSPLGDEANAIGIFVYDADANNDNTIDLGSSWDDLVNQVVGTGSFIMPENLGVDSLLNVPVFDFNDPTQAVPLKAGHAYYVSLFYDGANAGTGICPRFSNTLDVPYRLGNTTPLFVRNQWFGAGWGGAEVIQRLQLEGFDPLNAKEQKPLDASKYQVTPNPASDIVRLNLELAQVSKTVAVTLLDGMGRSVRSQVASDFQNGQITLNVADVPNGMYIVWIRTAEGSVMTKVTIAH